MDLLHYRLEFITLSVYITLSVDFITDVSVVRHRCESTGSAAHSCVALIEACLKAKPPEKR